MAFGTQDDTDEVMNEINMTPLVDVMLVLLIIFIITVPVMKHAVNIDLPRATNQPQDTKPETMRLSVDAEGSYYWNENKVADETWPTPAQGRSRQGTRSPSCTSAATRPCATSAWPRPWPPRSRPAVRKIGFITEPQAGQ
jgi:biopolymer transport protein ExbD